MLRFMVFVTLFCCTLQASGQHIQDVVYHLVGLNPRDTLHYPDVNQRAIIADFWSCIKELDKMDQNQKKLNGKAIFGFSGDQSDNQSLYKIDGGIFGSRGIYPGELSFTSNIGMVLNNGQFNENVSNIYMAYNYHPSWGDSISTENFYLSQKIYRCFFGSGSKV